MFKNILTFFLSSAAIFGADLGVLFDSTNNNTVSPDNLVIATFIISTNLELKYVTPARALSIDSNSNVVSSTLTDTQQGYLAALTGGTNLINLGSAKLIGAQGNPTNGVMSTNRTLYINTASANVNDSLWINLDTNWFRIASTNGGSINETQLNFSDVTTANATTFLHGLLPKLNGNSATFLNGLGAWATTAQYTGSTNKAIPVAVGNTAMITSANFTYDDSIGTLKVPKINIGILGFISGGGSSQISVDDARFNALADVTTGDVSTTAHGFAPKGDGNSAHFLNGIGGYSTPAGGGAGTISSTGSPLSTEMTYWTGTNTITGSSEFTYDRQVLTVPSILSANYQVPTASTNSQITSGTYIPTRTPVVNCSTAGTTSRLQHYTRIGNEITVTGRLQMTRISNGNLTFRVSLPIIPANNTGMELAGNGMVTDLADSFEVGPVIIYISGTTVEAEFKTVGSSTSGTVREFWYSFVYTTN